MALERKCFVSQRLDRVALGVGPWPLLWEVQEVLAEAPSSFRQPSQPLGKYRCGGLGPWVHQEAEGLESSEEDHPLLLVARSLWLSAFVALLATDRADLAELAQPPHR